VLRAVDGGGQACGASGCRGQRAVCLGGRFFGLQATGLDRCVWLHAAGVRWEVLRDERGGGQACGASGYEQRGQASGASGGGGAGCVSGVQCFRRRGSGGRFCGRRGSGMQCVELWAARSGVRCIGLWAAVSGERCFGRRGSGGRSVGMLVASAGWRCIGLREAGIRCAVRRVVADRIRRAVHLAAGVRREVVGLQAAWVRREVRQDASGGDQACGASCGGGQVGSAQGCGHLRSDSALGCVCRRTCRRCFPMSAVGVRLEVRGDACGLG
jgi:hypothetical protein